jgi:hypothetical protein
MAEGSHPVADMIEKVIILTAYPFNQRDYDRFGVELIRRKGFDVEIWDITACIHKKICDKLISDQASQFANLRTFSDKADIIRAISALNKKCIVNCFIEYSSRTFFIFKTLSKYQIKYCVLGMVTLPIPKPVRVSSAQHVKNLLKKISSLKIEEIFQHFLDMCLLKYHFLFGILPASVIILGGEKSYGANSYPVNNETERVWAHTFDYDLFLRERDCSYDHEGKYNVFLDEFLPFHPDFLTVGLGYPIPPEDYYPALCSFLVSLEEQTGAKTIIAAHPRSMYESMPDFFGGRGVIKGKTSLLVKNAALVIAHMSTSVNFAVLYQKPLIFITSDNLKKMNSGKNVTGLFIETIAREFGKNPVNIDHPVGFSLADEIMIDSDAYTRYIQHYIKKQGTPEKPIWEIYIKYLRQHFSSS